MIRAAAFAARATFTARSVLPVFARGFADGQIFSGSVKWFDSVKGFGFVMPDDGSADLFVHQTAIYKDGFRSLAEGEKVEYKVMTKDNGRMQAVDVTGPDGSYVQGAPQTNQGGSRY